MATATRTARRPATGPKEVLYSWEGKDKTGKMIRGEMRAAGEKVVQATMRRQGVMITKVKSRSSRVARASPTRTSPCSRQLATMMRSGVPLLQAFDIAMKGSGTLARAHAQRYPQRRGDRQQPFARLPQAPGSLLTPFTATSWRPGNRPVSWIRCWTVSPTTRKDPRHQEQDQVRIVLPARRCRGRGDRDLGDDAVRDT